MAELRRVRPNPSFSPDRLKQAGKAFDLAWSEIATNFAGDALATEAARQRLATIIIGFSAVGRRSAVRIRDAAVVTMGHR